MNQNIDTIPTAIRILSHFWLEEVQSSDIDMLSAIPELQQTLPSTNQSTLDELAVAYQNLFGFNLPPYESIFIDPSAMLMAPSTERVQKLYHQANWIPTTMARFGALDHIGIELLAWADGLSTNHQDWSNQLHTGHLALWVPAFIFTLKRLDPPEFYITLADLTLELILATLSTVEIDEPATLFPSLPPPPVYRGTDESLISPEQLLQEDQANSSGESPQNLRRIIKHLTTPREAGLFITRSDLAEISHTLDLPVVMGERYRMLDALFRQAGQYDLISDLLKNLSKLLQHTSHSFETLAVSFPNWQPYATAWQEKLMTSDELLKQLQETLTTSLNDELNDLAG